MKKSQSQSKKNLMQPQSYQPINWNFTTNQVGDREYEDHVLNVVQQNLKTISTLLDDIHEDARANISTAQLNVNTMTMKDSSVQTGGLFVSKIIEGLGVIFKAGTPTAIIATISCKIISGIITKVCEPSSEETYNKIISKVNNLNDMVDEICYQTQLVIGSCLDDMKGQWNLEYDCQDLKSADLKGKVKLSDLAGTNKEPFTDFLPKKATTEYIHARDILKQASKYESAKALVPVKWKIEYATRPDTFDHDSPFWWNVETYKVYNKNTWNDWHSRSNFPYVDDDLKGDIEGPNEEIESGMSSDPHQQGFGFDDRYGRYDHNYTWSDGLRYDQGKYMFAHSRWMGLSGRNKHELSTTRDLIKGTSFLDLIQDVLDGKYHGIRGDQRHSHLLWYKTKRKDESVEIINDKRVWTLMGNNACMDWKYDWHGIFTWGRAYRGIELNHYVLVDENGGYASKEICDWLFKDDGHGNSTSAVGIAKRIDVYFGWGIEIKS